MGHFDKSTLDKVNLFKLNLQLAMLKWGDTDCIIDGDECPLSDSVYVTWPDADEGLPISIFFSFNQQWAAYVSELKINISWQQDILFLSSPIFRPISFERVHDLDLPKCIALYYLIYQVEIVKHPKLIVTGLLQLQQQLR